MKTLEEAIEAIEALQAQVNDLAAGKNRGPKSDRPMTEQDAWDIKFGKHKELNHKEAAAITGLSYGQVFSARGGYTFKTVKADWKPKTPPKETP